MELKQQIGVVEIGCGLDFSCALSSSGSLFTWGCGKKGSLGHGDENIRNKPTKVKGLKGVAINGIACGGHHMLAWTNKPGEVYCWGGNGTDVISY